MVVTGIQFLIVRIITTEGLRGARGSAWSCWNRVGGLHAETSRWNKAWDTREWRQLGCGEKSGEWCGQRCRRGSPGGVDEWQCAVQGVFLGNRWETRVEGGNQCGVHSEWLIYPEYGRHWQLWNHHTCKLCSLLRTPEALLVFQRCWNGSSQLAYWYQRMGTHTAFT